MDKHDVGPVLSSFYSSLVCFCLLFPFLSSSSLFTFSLFGCRKNATPLLLRKIQKQFITVFVFVNGRHFSLSNFIKRRNFFKQRRIIFLAVFRSGWFCQQNFAFGHVFKIVIENCPCICRIDTFYSNIDVFVHTVPPIF